jgi:SAM-dependent methyltransferase
MSHVWSTNDLAELMRSYQGACILLAAAELDIFTVLQTAPLTSAEVAKAIGGDLRATTYLLDSLAGLELLAKQNNRYSPAPGTVEVLTGHGRQSMLAMAQHLANCMRNWAQLARVVKTGKPARHEASIRGESADYASFIEAMDNISRKAAPDLVEKLPPLQFNHLLDVGGASGTWTIVFLRRYPKAKATLFDLPKVIPQATARLTEADMLSRVRLIGGDFLVDPLPPGPDLAWVSAIIHQMSREHNRKLYASVFQALQPGGRILIRDFVMDSTHTKPAAGTLFAINMLVNTETGATFTFDEIAEDLRAAGFQDPTMLHTEDTMYSVAMATKPE